MVSGVRGRRTRLHGRTGGNYRAADASMRGLSRGRKTPFTSMLERLTGGNSTMNILLYLTIIVIVIIRKTGVSEKYIDLWSRLNVFNHTAAPLVTTATMTPQDENTLLVDYQNMLKSLIQKDYSMEISDQTIFKEERGINSVGYIDLESSKSVIDMKRRFWMTFHSMLDSTQLTHSQNQDKWTVTASEAAHVSSCSKLGCGSDGSSFLVIGSVPVKASSNSIISVIHPKKWKKYRQLGGKSNSGEVNKIHIHGGKVYQSLLSVADDFELGRKSTLADDNMSNDQLCVTLIRTLANKGKSLAMLNAEFEDLGPLKTYQRTKEDIIFVINTKSDETSQFVDLSFIGRYDSSILSRNSILEEDFRSEIVRELLEVKRVSELYAKVVEDDPEFSEL